MWDTVTQKRGRTAYEAELERRLARLLVQYIEVAHFPHQSPSRAKTGVAARCVTLLSVIRLCVRLSYVEY